jgi:hypothetical protein
MPSTTPRGPARLHSPDLLPSPPQGYPAPNSEHTSWDHNYPQTWPILYLPYHDMPGQSTPTSLGQMLPYAEYRGVGAIVLRNLLIVELHSKDSEEEMEQVELMAHMMWPYNMGIDGVYKVIPDLNENELLVWYRLRMETVS